MRNPSIHQLAGVRHDRGLSNYLTGEDNIDFLTLPMEDPGFPEMSAGPLPPNSAVFMNDGRRSPFIATLLEHYDPVAFDSPPVMGHSDHPLTGATVIASS